MKRDLLIQWTTVMAKGLRTLQPYCSFAFKWHVLKNKYKERGQNSNARATADSRTVVSLLSVTVDRERDLKTLTEEVFKSGCRDEGPSPHVLKIITREIKLKS